MIVSTPPHSKSLGLSPAAKHVWLGHDFKHPIRVWEHGVRPSGVLVNAYQLARNPAIRDRVRHEGLGRVVGFDGPFFVDSGGFQFAAHGKAAISPAQVAAIYRELNVTRGAALDIPLDPTASNGENLRRWRRTVANTNCMRAELAISTVVPVLHTYSASAVRARLRALWPLREHPRQIAVGSLVPLIQGKHLGNRFGSGDRLMVRRWRLIGGILDEVRAAFPSSEIHVFGAGSPATVLLLFALGVNSVDSVGWRLKAAYGDVFVSGYPARNISPHPPRQGRRIRLADECRDVIERCVCPACSMVPARLRVCRLRHCYRLRATHNAHCLLADAEGFSRAQRAGGVAEYLHNRLRHHPWLPAIMEVVSDR